MVVEKGGALSVQVLFDLRDKDVFSLQCHWVRGESGHPAAPFVTTSFFDAQKERS